MMHIDRITGDFSDWWAARDYGNQLGKWKAATLMAHGFNDWNVMPEHSVRIYAALKQNGVPGTANFHQGGHDGTAPPAPGQRWLTTCRCAPAKRAAHLAAAGMSVGRTTPPHAHTTEA